MNGKLHINLTLDAHRVPLDINPENEAIYREAGAMLNRRYQFYQRRMPQASAEQLWVYVALESAVNLQSDARQKNLEPVLKKMENLNLEIEEKLKNINPQS